MTYVQYQTREKETVSLDIGAEATGVFGFVFQDRVSTPKGLGTVLGVANGMLYFQLDNDTGCSYWGSCRSRQDFEAKGFRVVPTDNIRRHRIKRVTVGDSSRSVVLQDINGPCPLLAAVNALALKGVPLSEVSGGCDVITQDTLCDAVEERIRSEPGVTQLPGRHFINGVRTLAGYVSEEAERFRAHFSRSKVVSLFEGLDVTPFFTGVGDFEGEKDAAFFASLGLRLFHLWVVGNEDVPEGLRNRSYNQLQDLAVSEVDSSAEAVRFLTEYSNQITELGVAMLKEEMGEREVGILFRNNHFSTVMKIEGDLFVLVTDEGYGDKAIIVFEKLSLSGDTSYHDGDGCPIEPIVLESLCAHGDQYSREKILATQTQLGGNVSLAEIIAAIEGERPRDKKTDSRSVPPALPQNQAPPEALPTYFEQLLEMGFDRRKCEEICKQQPESLDVAIALLLH